MNTTKQNKKKVNKYLKDLNLYFGPSDELRIRSYMTRTLDNIQLGEKDSKYEKVTIERQLTYALEIIISQGLNK
jgi:hypothetical protein